jgi:hypothetical protein
LSGASILVYAERLGGSLGHIEKLLENEVSDFAGQVDPLNEFCKLA